MLTLCKGNLLRNMLKQGYAKASRKDYLVELTLKMTISGNKNRNKLGLNHSK